MIETVLLEGNVQFIEMVHSQLRRNVLVSGVRTGPSAVFDSCVLETDTHSSGAGAGAASGSNVQSVNKYTPSTNTNSISHPNPDSKLDPATETTAVTTTTTYTTASNTASGRVRRVGSSQIDWYGGVKGQASCPIVILGGDVQITDGTKVRASLHFSSIASTPLTGINLEEMRGRWFYEVSFVLFYFISKKHKCFSNTCINLTQ